MSFPDLAIHCLEFYNDLLSLLIGSLCQETNDGLFIRSCITAHNTIDRQID